MIRRAALSFSSLFHALTEVDTARRRPAWRAWMKRILLVEVVFWREKLELVNRQGSVKSNAVLVLRRLEAELMVLWIAGRRRGIYTFSCVYSLSPEACIRGKL
jgi:hypothetical protein